MTETEREVLDVTEAADLLRVPIGTIYELAQQRKIPAKKVGRHWRFRRAALLAWLLKPRRTTKRRTTKRRAKR